mgnify:FL=1
MYAPVFVTLLVLIFTNENEGLKRTRLETRLKLLEDKLFYESSEFRDDIQRLFNILNNTFADIKGGDEDQSKTEIPLSIDKDRSDLLQTSDNHHLQATLKTGFAQEKLRLRQYVSILQLGLQTIQDNVSKKLGSVTRDVMDIRTGLNSNCVNQTLTLERISDRLSTLETNGEIIVKTLDRLEANLIHNVKEITEQNQATTTNLPTTLHTPGKEWKKFGNSYYYFNGELSTWYSAKQKCESMGAYLMEVNSQDELTFLETHRQHHTFCWIGGRVSGEKEVWKWRDKKNSDMTYLQALRRQKVGTDPACLTYIDNVYGWYLAPCDREWPFACEI